MNAITPFSTGRELAIREIEGEARILDINLAQRLGFGKPLNIRKLIDRHRTKLADLGVLSTVEKTSGVAGGRPTKEYHLNRRQALFVVTKSETPVAVDITVEVVRRFDDYEQGSRPAAPINLRDPASLLRLSADLARELQASQAVVTELEPKAAALDRLAARNGAENITDTAKALGVRPSWLFDWLYSHRWTFRRYDNGPWRAHQDKLNSGLLTHVERPDPKWPDRSFTVCLVTPKGRARLAELIEREARAATAEIAAGEHG